MAGSENGVIEDTLLCTHDFFERHHDAAVRKVVGALGLAGTWVAALPGLVVATLLVAWFSRVPPRARHEGPGPWVVLATAHPWKFPEVVEPLTGTTMTAPPGLAVRLEGAEHEVHLPADGRALRGLLLEEGSR